MVERRNSLCLYILFSYIEIIPLIESRRSTTIKERRIIFNHYINYNIQYGHVYNLINNFKFRKINFFIDLQSICTGFYNHNVVLMEINHYVQENKISDKLLTEYHAYCLNLYQKFKQYDPYFITFFDNGKCQQNKIINSGYKQGRSLDNVILLDQEQVQLFRTIKKYYFNEIYKRFNNKTVASTYYLENYEADLIPFYCLKNDLFDSQDKSVINIVLSKDKDLLQCLQYTNTYQFVSNYKKSQKTKYSRLFNDEDCIEYIYNNFKRGHLTSKHVSIILSICGDKSDGIDGVKGLGPAKASDLVRDYNIPTEYDLIKLYENHPKIIKENLDLILNNFRQIDFNEQIKRIPNHILEAK